MASPAAAHPRAWTHLRPVRTGTDVLAAAASLAIVAAAELTFIVAGLAAGAAAGIAAVAILVAVAVRARPHLRGRFAAALAVLPLLRVLSIAVPTLMVPQWLWYAEIGIPVISATLIAAVIARIHPASLGVRPAPVPVIGIAAAVGLLVGLFGYLLVQPDAAAESRSPLAVAGAAGAILVGGVLAEELLFRGLLQAIGEELGEGLGVLLAAALCTLFTLATGDVRYVVLMAAVALGLGLVTRRYRSLLPAVACHAVLLWSQLLLWPNLLR